MYRATLSKAIDFRRTYIMSSLPAMSATSPFTRAVVLSMRRLYPEALVNKYSDNTGRKSTLTEPSRAFVS